MRKKRKSYTAEEKVSILKRHLLEKEAISDICEEFHLQPTVFYRWQKEFFENGAAAFSRHHPRTQNAEQKKIQHLEGKIQQKNEVMSELLEAHVKLKKALGEL